jgi:ABC-type transport system involved in multi-copper enzyme maturation permease subunit
MPDLRLISADVLKLRRRRGMLAVCAGLTLGILLLAFTVITLQHGADPAKTGPAGGLHGFLDSLPTISVTVFLVGAIVGATAGAQDLDTGVFRDLAATGRSRTALFLSRVGGAWVVTGALTLITLAVDVAGAFLLADGTSTPHLSDIVQGGAMLLASGAFGAGLAVGLAALVGSRGPVIAILLAMHLIFEPQLQGAGFLGDARQALPISAINRIGDQAQDLDYTLALSTSIAVVAAWVVAALAAGAWRTRTREI